MISTERVGGGRMSGFTGSDHSTLKGFFEATPGYALANEWETWANQYAEYAVLQPPNSPSIEGRENILAWGRAFPQAEYFSFDDIEVSGHGDLAWGTSTYKLKIPGFPEDRGKQLGVFRRKPNGGWEVIALSFNSDLPMTAAPNPPPTV
jgi:ketosteroid isomerase-like protein